jgi:uncharacterized protein YndB with AHSA1/START domain
MTQPITVETVVRAPVQKAWQFFTEPEHMLHWNNASDDWHTTKATNDVRVGGIFSYRMESLDGKQGFDLTGVYDEVIPHNTLAYTMGDGRKVHVVFTEEGDVVRVTETFDPEAVNSVEIQRGGWQAILDTFKKYIESR